jgi:hypothetical protein
MQQIGASCPSCGLFHIHGNCVSSGSSQEQERQKFTHRAQYIGLGEEKDFCGKRAIILTCRRFLHDHALLIYCGREWCEVCGEFNSYKHLKRSESMMWRAFHLGIQSKAFGLGYFVFTVPYQCRDSLRKKRVLRDAERFLLSLLKRYGFSETVSKWHLFGDDPGVFHPHLNILVTGRWLRDNELNAIREAWRKYLKMVSGEMVDAVDFKYKYFKSQNKWVDLVRYITRPTFRCLQGNEALALEFYRFRNYSYKGFGSGTELDKKRSEAKALYALWKVDNKGEDKADKYFDVHTIVCEKCSLEGVMSKLSPRQTFNGFREVVSLEEIKPRIEKELRHGFYSLSPPIILTNKPENQVEDNPEAYEGGYDTS